MQIQAPALRNAKSSWQRELCAVAALQAFPCVTTGLACARERVFLRLDLKLGDLVTH